MLHMLHKMFESWETVASAEGKNVYDKLKTSYQLLFIAAFVDAKPKKKLESNSNLALYHEF